MIIFILAFLLFTVPAYADPVFDASTFLKSSGSTSETATLVIGGGCTNNIVIVDIINLNNVDVTVSAVTVDGNAATNIAAIDTVFGNVRAEMWYQLNVATGSRSVTVDFADGSNILIIGARSYCGVNQSSPIGTAATDNDSSTSTGNVVVSSASGDLVIDTVASGDPNITVDASQTSRINQNDNAGPYIALGASEKTGASSVTMQWTRGGGATAWALVGVSLKPVSAGGAVAKRRIVSSE